jgi:hypothetical protein
MLSYDVVEDEAWLALDRRIAFAVVSTHQPALGPRGGLWPILRRGNP